MNNQAYQLCMEIEELPASEQQTKVSVMAADLLREMEAVEADIVAANCMLEDALEVRAERDELEAENKRLREMLIPANVTPLNFVPFDEPEGM